MLTMPQIIPNQINYTIIPPTPQKQSRPSWIKFHETKTTQNKPHNQIITTALIKTALILKIVTINKDGILTDTIEQPNTNCYFMIKCVLFNSAILLIITDGKKYLNFYPIDTSYRHHLECTQNKTKPRAPWKEATYQLGPYDKDFLNAAIKLWLGKTS